MLLHGELIKLRALEPQDLNNIYTWENDTQTWHVGDTVTPFSQFILKQYLKESHRDIYDVKQLRLMIILKDEPKVAIGTIDLFDYNPFHNRAGLGILIDEKFRKKGYASDAINTMLDYCINYLNMHQVFCHITADNTASIQLFSKCGFTKCGELKQWNKGVSEYKNVFIMQYIKAE